MLPAVRNHTDLPTGYEGPVNRVDAFFDRVLDRFFDDGLFGPTRPAWERAWGRVPLAMWEDDDRVYVEAELPGLAESDLEITVHNGMLAIRGERKPEPDRQFLYNGRGYGRFERVISLPTSVDADRVEAELGRGLLRVTLPKSPEARPKRITLRSSS